MSTEAVRHTDAQPQDESGHTVTVKVFGGLRQRLGGSGSLRMALPSQPTISGLLADLEVAHPDLVTELRTGLDDGYLNILVNGRNARLLAGFDTELSADDTIAFLPPVGGG